MSCLPEEEYRFSEMRVRSATNLAFAIFPQVGRDQRAQHFLEKLDKSPEVGDIIDCTSYYELEAEEFKRKGIDMTVEIWLVKLMVGAVDPSYDAEDEG